MSVRRRRVVITNIVALNVGDAAILEGTIAVLRRALGDDVDVVVFDKAAAAASRYFPWATFRQALFSRPAAGWRRRLSAWGWGHRVRRFDAWRLRLVARWLGSAPALARRLLSAEARADLEAYRSADLVVSSGGTYLVEKYGLEPPILDYELTLALGRPLVFFTQSLGPFRDPDNRRRLGRIFREARALLVRDAPSQAHLEELGVPAYRVLRCADAAFALARDPAPSGDSDRPPRIAISVREWRHFRTTDPAEGQRRYLDSVAALVARLVRERDASVVFLSTCQGMPEYWTDDSQAALEIAGRLREDVARRVEVDREARGPRELIDAYAGFDAVVATRMHAAILALCAGTPVLPIAYEFKTRALFEGMGLGEWVTDIEAISPDSFSVRGDAFLSALPDLRATVAREVPRLREAAFRPVDRLREIVSEGGRKD